MIAKSLNAVSTVLTVATSLQGVEAVMVNRSNNDIQKEAEMKDDQALAESPSVWEMVKSKYTHKKAAFILGMAATAIVARDSVQEVDNQWMLHKLPEKWNPAEWTKMWNDAVENAAAASIKAKNTWDRTIREK